MSLSRRHFAAFTLIELLVALSITAILASLVLANSFSSLERRRFLELQEVATRLAVAQQTHVLVFNQYASNVLSSGNSNPNNLVFEESSTKSIRIISTTVTGFTAEVKARPGDSQPGDLCHSVRLIVDKGFGTLQAFDNNGVDSTSNCLAHG